MDLTTYTKLVASYIDGWDAATRHRYYLLRHPESGGEIYLSPYKQGKQQRIKVSGHFWHNRDYVGYYLPYEESDTRIYQFTAKADTDPAKLAKRIETKLIPLYLPKFRHCIRGYKVDKEREEQRQALGEELAAIVKTTCSGDKRKIGFFQKLPYANYSQVRVTVDYKIHIEIELGEPEPAKQFLKALAALALSDS